MINISPLLWTNRVLLQKDVLFIVLGNNKQVVVQSK